MTLSNERQWKALGTKLRLARKALRKSVQQLADECGCDPSTIYRIERGEHFPRHWATLAKALALDPGELSRIVGIPDAGDASRRLRAISFAELFRTGGTPDDIFDRIGNEYPFPIQYENEWGDDTAWSDIYLHSSHTGYVLKDGEHIVGYWLFIFVADEIFDAGMRGENINGRLSTADMILPFMPGDYKAYFVDAFLSIRYLEAGSMGHLARAFYRTLETLAGQEIFVSDFFANISTDYSQNLVAQSGFTKVCDHQVHQQFDRAGNRSPTSIYHLDMSKEFRRLFGKSKLLTGDLTRIYAGHFRTVD